MTEKVYEQLSAMVDDELPEGERALLIERMARDAALRERWERYHLIGDVLHDRLVVPPDARLAERVMAAVAQETTPKSRGGIAAWRGAIKAAAGLAVAASVAWMALIAVQSITRQDESVPALASRSESADPPVVRVGDGQWRRQSPEVQARLNGYLVNHNEYAVSSGVQGVLPYMRIVGYDRQDD